MWIIGAALHTVTALFITLKLVGAISWSWLWVLAPSLTAFGIAGLILALAGIYLGAHWIFMRDPSYRARYLLNRITGKYVRGGK